jgi:HEAT repeat protein
LKDKAEDVRKDAAMALGQIKAKQNQ